jgi:hydrogenase expression/formation protein HypD
MTQRTLSSHDALCRLRAAAQAIDRPVAFMEVCGTHTVNACRCGLHSLMPSNVRLISGPGCPVCVTSQGDIDMLIELARRPGVTLCTYGDMMRVTGKDGNLEEARSTGSDIRVIYSALDAVHLAASDPNRNVVFAGVGFETTTPATAVAVLEAERLNLQNFTVLVSHKRILPAMRTLLDSGQIHVDGFLCPGHVSTVTGYAAFAMIVRRYHLPCVVAGFEDVQIAAGLARLVELVRDQRAELENLYPQAVTRWGNRRAQNIIRRVFRPVDARWRGLGLIPDSGLAFRSRFSRFDAQIQYKLTPLDSPEPPGCRCGEVITGRCTPPDCKLFAQACTPVRPIGPCMVSSEGTCQAWFKYRRAAHLAARNTPATSQNPQETTV